MSRVANAVAGASSVDAALIALCSRIADAFGTSVIPFVRAESSWRPVGDTADIDSSMWLPTVSASASGSDECALVSCDDAVATEATLIRVGMPFAPEAVVVIEGDWTSLHETLAGLSAVARLALDAVHERAQTDVAERQVIGGYAMARRLSRLDSVESVAQQIVDSVAHLIKADRVSLSIYKSTEDALSIVATHGYPRAEVADVRVRPGEWVLGHVYASKRSLFVADVRALPEVRRRNSRYRTFAFAAVPLLAGREAVGVLTVTDKRDGASFNHEDEIVLRALSTIAATSLVAARSNHEAAQLAYAATIDALTGLMNRPSLDKRLHQEVERSRREKTSLAVLMADIDDFKRINDSRGHHVGDTVLRAIAGVVRSAVRVFDVCARYGGDEFAIVMPNCDRHSAVACAERIRARLSEMQRQTDNASWLGELKLSIGVAVIRDDESPSELLQRADHCLYQAKASGKDAVRSDEAREPVAIGPRPVPPRPDDAAATAITQLPPHEPAQLSYVLVVDTDDARLNLCLQAVQPFTCGLLVARTGSLAASLIERFGPPMVLIVDLLLPSGDAFVAIDALRQDQDATTEVVAWSASKLAREFAAARMRSGRVVSTTAGNATLTAAIQTALERRQNRGRTRDVADTPDEMATLASDLIERVRRICTLPGVAVYLKDAYDDGFRLTVSWLPEDIPPPPLDVPAVFNRVHATSCTVFQREARDESGSEPNKIRGVIGVPIAVSRQVVGVICAYDVNPLRLDAPTVAALEGLGATVLQPAARSRIAAEGNAGDHSERGFDDRRAATAGAAQARGNGVDSAWPPALLDRSGGEFAIARELSRAKREGRQLSIVLFSVSPGRLLPPHPPESDLDDVADTLLKAVRQSDLPIRWSVTELLVVLPGLGTKEAKSVAERVRAALAAGTKNRVPVSGGVEEIGQDDSFLNVVDRARQRVASAVDRGHNRVV